MPVMSVRAVWVLAAVVVGGAVVAAAWPRGAQRAEPRSAPPRPAAAEMLDPGSVPAAEAPTLNPPKPSILEDYLGGSLAAPTTSAPTLTVGAAARIERLDDRTVQVTAGKSGSSVRIPPERCANAWSAGDFRRANT
ncbi:MAG: hypothetical protein ACKOFI_06360, partial [Phycisphaerales bacterium]